VEQDNTFHCDVCSYSHFIIVNLQLTLYLIRIALLFVCSMDFAVTSPIAGFCRRLLSSRVRFFNENSTLPDESGVVHETVSPSHVRDMAGQLDHVKSLVDSFMVQVEHKLESLLTTYHANVRCYSSYSLIRIRMN